MIESARYTYRSNPLNEPDNFSSLDKSISCDLKKWRANVSKNTNFLENEALMSSFLCFHSKERPILHPDQLFFQ